ncbi:MAG: electron transfer flavoprotein subunit beta/FixA family protein [Acidimicrobiaceae bacterium]|nr:electron transfer flavoprotein subunit beta/FixA family protein [Acidimicrobiaceae bacterium]
MRVAVCVKHVPDGRVMINPETRRLDRSGPGDLNGADRYALEEALRLRDANGAEVVAVSMGPKGATETVRSALGLGADRGVLASDPAAEGSDLLGTARVLARVIEREEPDLVLFGQQSTDGGGALLWAAVADLLRRPFVSQASTLTVQDETVRVGRQTETGDEQLEVPLPAIVSVGDSINEPRYSSLKGMMAAKKKPLQVASVEDLGLDPAEVGEAGAATCVLSVGPPPARAGGERIEDDGTASERIVEFLVAKGVV